MNEDDKTVETRRHTTALSPDPERPLPFEKKKKKDEEAMPVLDMAARVVVEPTEFYDCMQQIARSQIHDEKKRRYYFRGESSSAYTLLPTLLRDYTYETLKSKHDANSPIDLQKKLLDRFRRYTQHLIHADNDFNAEIWADFDTLCLAQHYGLPTLLMDWTLNPYVAAYFAVSGAYRRRIREHLSANPNSEQYCVRVWAMRLKPSTDRKKHTVHLEERGQEWDRYLGNMTLAPSGPLIVVPLVFTRRIAAQAGRFVYCGHAASDHGAHSDRLYSQSLAKYSYDQTEHGNEAILPWDQLYSLDILFEIKDWRSAWKESHHGNEYDEQSDRDSKRMIEFKLKEFRKRIGQMISGLDFTGFHAGRLFPDLEGWARYLAEGNL
ncbi:MAG: FRG domain-containing protein [Planctomycetaceae bacterium]|nr:FRG domain-containing protein [Planctomycetaceae bacterium]